ncbi:MAG TPA: YihY/virulence factor BrkB family protein [Candidatus Eisenbacteria bacterium]|nr:YihY/virulence factor BrkB family protein [Candidatus Eisenbacteria bacterium]
MFGKADPKRRTKTGAARPRGRSPWRVAKQVAAGVFKHECMGSSAQIAYYLLFATFPLLLSLTSLPAFLPVPNLAVWLIGLLGTIAPSDAVDLMRVSAERAVTRQRSDLFTFGVVAAVWAGANAVEAIMQGLNRVQGLRETRPVWKTRGVAILLAVEVSILAVLGLLGLWFGSQVSRWWDVRGGLGPLPVQVWDLARWPLVLILLIAAIDQLYFIGPAVRPRWRWITPGSIVAVLGWIAASLGLSAYVRHFGSYNATFGSIGAVIILLTWMYLTAFFILLGAEINVAAREGESPSPR